MDLFEIALFIGESNPEAALRFIEAAEATFKQLAAMPGMGRPRNFKIPACTICGPGKLRDLRTI